MPFCWFCCEAAHFLNPSPFQGQLYLGSQHKKPVDDSRHYCSDTAPPRYMLPRHPGILQNKGWKRFTVKFNKIQKLKNSFNYPKIWAEWFYLISYIYASKRCWQNGKHRRPWSGGSSGTDKEGILWLIRDKFAYFSIKHMLWVLIRITSPRWF